MKSALHLFRPVIAEEYKICQEMGSLYQLNSVLSNLWFLTRRKVSFYFRNTLTDAYGIKVLREATNRKR